MNITLISFNMVSDEFLQKLIKTFPEENKLSLYYMYYCTMKKMSDKSPMEYIMSQFYDKGYYILTRDESFFRKDEILSNFESFTQRTGIVDKWDSINPEIKNNIWEYVQSLYVLGMRALGKNSELKEVIDKVNSEKNN